MQTTPYLETPSRNQQLPLFDPHVSTFACSIEASKLSEDDAQATQWFLEARALESAEIFPTKRDYTNIVRLTRQAAERNHWMAMLNLASLYLEGHSQSHGVPDALELVEAAMKMGVPAAYDRMGTYHMNGTGVQSNATRAYAFWQRAATMGNPQALTFLGEKMDAAYDDPKGTFWANKHVGLGMLECALSQGANQAAFELSFQYANPSRAPASTDKRNALKVLHDGTKLGSELCAARLEIEFGAPYNPEKMLAPYIDKARAERYRLLSDALSFDPSDRFPNLDKVVPLPPAELPPWNGDRDTLLFAARGVSPPPEPVAPSAESQRTGRYFLDAAYSLRDTGEETSAPTAPVEAYWQPIGKNVGAKASAELAKLAPGLYKRGEPFPTFPAHPDDKYQLTGTIVWRRWITAPRNPHAVAPQAAKGLVRIVARPLPWVSSPSGAAVPVTGTWQPWVRPDHPLRGTVNQYWRQAWLVKGQPFPLPERDWLLPLPAADVTWHLMEKDPPSLLQRWSAK